MPARPTPMSNAVPTPRSKVIATYDYHDAEGNLVGQVLRYDPKNFKQRRPNGAGGWEWKEPQEKYPFHLPQLLAADPEDWVFIVEGEKDVLALESLGLIATCNLGGAARDVKPYAPFFRGRKVAIIPDNDPAGHKHADKWVAVVDRFSNITLKVTIENHDSNFSVTTENDISDWINRGGCAEKLMTLVESQLKSYQVTEVTGGVPAHTVLRDVESFLRRFVVYPNEHAAVAHTLWIAHTWTMELWDSTPRIAFLSAEPGSGKTRALEGTEQLVPNPWFSVNSSTMFLYRSMTDPDGPPTILFDEIDAIFGEKAKEHEDTRSLINAGHRRGGQAGRLVPDGNTFKPERFPAYCAVALAGLGKLPSTIEDRSIKIPMHKRHVGEPIEPFRLRIVQEEVTRLKQSLEKKISYVYKQMEGYYPELPLEIQDRDADVWEPLIIIADIFGGAWPVRARAAAIHFVGKAKEVPQSIKTRLLEDIRTIFGTKDRMSMREICDLLSDLEDAPWREWHKSKETITTYQLGKLIAEYGLRATNIHIGPSHKPKGYLREDLENLWQRYLPPLGDPENSGNPVTSAQPGQETGYQEVTKLPESSNFSSNGVDPDPRPY